MEKVIQIQKLLEKGYTEEQIIEIMEIAPSIFGITVEKAKAIFEIIAIKNQLDGKLKEAGIESFEEYKNKELDNEKNELKEEEPIESKTNIELNKIIDDDDEYPSIINKFNIKNDTDEVGEIEENQQFDLPENPFDFYQHNPPKSL